MMIDRIWYLSESHFPGTPILPLAITFGIFKTFKQVLIKVQVDMYMPRGQLDAVQSRSIGFARTKGRHHTCER